MTSIHKIICQPVGAKVMTPGEITRAVLGKMGETEEDLWAVAIPVKEAADVMGSWPDILAKEDGDLYMCWIDRTGYHHGCIYAYPRQDGLGIYEWCVRSMHGFGEASSLEGACQEWRESMLHSQRRLEAEMLWAPVTGEQ